MQEYEIRILKADRTTSLVFESPHLNDHAAISEARMIADGAPFEVWCGLDCVLGEHHEAPPDPPGALHLDGIDEIYTVRTARQLFEQYGDAAQMEAAMRAAKAIKDRNIGGEQLWDAVADAVRALESKSVGGA
jgi:hypothetical protein